MISERNLFIFFSNQKIYHPWNLSKANMVLSEQLYKKEQFSLGNIDVG